MATTALHRLFLPIRLVDEKISTPPVQRARRKRGEKVAEGTLKLSVSEVSFSVRKNAPEAAKSIAALYERGFQRIVAERKSDPMVRKALRVIRAVSGKARVSFFNDNDLLAAYVGPGPKGKVPELHLDAGWSVGTSEVGEELLAGMALLATLAFAEKSSTQRSAIYRFFDLYQVLSEAERGALRGVMCGNRVDNGNAFGNALDSSYNSQLALESEDVDLVTLQDVPTEDLLGLGHKLDTMRYKQQGRALLTAVREAVRKTMGERDPFLPRDDESPSAYAERVLRTIECNLKWRDTWATCALGHDRVDFPYHHDPVIELLNTPFDDIDEKRALINESISKTYDYSAEGDNIARLSAWAAEHDIRLVAGRLSRAFGNQAHLLSTAKYIDEKESLAPLAERLEKATRETPDLHTAALRILHLVREQKRTPFARMVGALNLFEEALVKYQAAASQHILQEADEASRRLLSRAAVDLTRERLGAEAELAGKLFRISAGFRKRLEACKKAPAAYVILMQRLHPAETINLANANAYREVHPGKEEDLHDLVRLGGNYTYSSTGPGRIEGPGGSEETHWVIKVNDWVEAIPLFIKERVVTREVGTGAEKTSVESIETEVDQEAMEAFFRYHAEFWVRNLDEVMDSERVGLARVLLAEGDRKLNKALEAKLEADPTLVRDDAARLVLRENPKWSERIPEMAALIAASEDTLLNNIHHAVEKDALPRRVALQRVLCEDARERKSNLVGQALLAAEGKETLAAAVERLYKAKSRKLKAIGKRLEPIALTRTRPVSSLHILTTESAGMTEGYVQSWIEEEMALYNVIKAKGLEAEVAAEEQTYRKRILALGTKVIDEYGMRVVVEEVMAEQRCPEHVAVLTVIFTYKPVADQVAVLAALLEAGKDAEATLDTEPTRDIASVEAHLNAHRTELEAWAVPLVAENNGRAFEQRMDEVWEANPKATRDEATRAAIASEQDYAEELESLIRFEARRIVLERLSEEQPELDLQARARTYLRRHTQLSRSTARKRVLARHSLNVLTNDPRHYYQATGGNKRYNLLYTPSRVNLGHRERDSVVKWRQWVGGADAAAAQAGFDVYSLVNEGGVEERPALSYAEIQKTSENGLCVTHYAGSNALGLLCMAVLEGDVQDMADQMNLREDRYIPPAGEGYGGYCVPKDGLFLAFVLSLTNEVKLRQIGIPDHLQAGVIHLAKQALMHRGDYESELDWQQWAAKKFLHYDVLKEHFDVRDDMVVFHIGKIAKALENLGQPWHETADGPRLIANLAADWGVERMVIHAEQVNRFMVFYKAWSIYQALATARAKHPACPLDRDARINISAEYKPVQDVRFSTGLRLFEIFAKTGDHLHYAMDEEGQNLVYLMFEGFDPDTEHAVGKRVAREVLRTFNISENDTETIARLKAAFPGHCPPADLVTTSVTLSSTQDMLFYVSDTRLDEIANQVQVQLGDYGLTEDQIRANAEVYGGDVRRWAGISHLSQEEVDGLVGRVGGGIHALVLKMRGPGRDYETDVQGVDVFNTGIPFKELITLVQDPPKLVTLMLQGNPNSALVIADGCAGRDPRALTDYDIQAFFAACERFGRQGTYIGMGLGQHNIERLEEEMRIWRSRGRSLMEAVQAVADADAKSVKQAARQALSVYEEIQRLVNDEDSAGKALRREEKLRRYKKWLPRDAFISQALVKVASGLPLGCLDAGTWIAGLGGTFVLLGERKCEVDALLERFEMGIAKIAKLQKKTVATDVVSFAPKDVTAICDLLLRPAYEPDSGRFTQQKLVETSSKAVEVAAVEALERRRALRVRAETAKAMSDREDGFNKYFDAERSDDFETYEKAARTLMEDIYETVERFDPQSDTASAARTKISRAFGALIARTRNALETLAADLMPGDADEDIQRRRAVDENIAQLYTGREIILEDWKLLAGGYEDMGDLARLAQRAEKDPKALDRVARGMELFYVTFGLGQTLQFALDDPDEIDERLFYKNLTDFFAETINDHWYDYLPWVFARGTGFSHLSAEELYKLSVDRHEWLYRFIRCTMVRCTDLRNHPEQDVDALLGKVDNGKVVVTGIGAGADSKGELLWRAYNQLREISFTHSDGFPTPPVFREFDPDLIEGDKRVNAVFLYPVGRTHVSRALREGPALNDRLKGEGKKGANLLITRHGKVQKLPGTDRRILSIGDGHLYVDRGTYVNALQKHKGMSSGEADAAVKSAQAAGAFTDKGIRIAARFAQAGRAKRIVIGALIPFHGLPLFEDGTIEEIGIPATVQSLVYADITYDKSLYPEIYTESTGVTLPPEMDWKREYGVEKTETEIKEFMTRGVPGNGYAGLREFGKKHPIVLIKGAAESGARNLKVFDVQDQTGQLNDEAVTDAVDFLYDVSQNQNVVVQAAILTSPEFWAGPYLMQDFVERQILEWNTPVSRDRLPRSQIYGSLRIVACSSGPDQPYDMAFPIILTSMQVATNVGRGGTLEKLLDDFVQEKYSKQIRKGLESQAPKVMKAMSKYVKDYEKVYEEQRGRKVGADARGVSYSWSPYLMLDYLVSPVFSRPGRLVDIEPVYDEAGNRIGSAPILQDEHGRFEAEIEDWQFIHLEPNVGIGLWDRFTLREEVLEQRACEAEGRPFNWDNVGTSDRIVLRNFIIAGEQYLDAVLS